MIKMKKSPKPGKEKSQSQDKNQCRTKTIV